MRDERDIRLSDEMDVIRAASEMDVAVDRSDWSAVRSFFADRAVIEIGSPPTDMASDDFVRGVEEANTGKIAFHSRTNPIATIDGDNATLTAHWYAWSQYGDIPESLYEAWGRMDHGFKRIGGRWFVVRVALHVTRSVGTANYRR